VTIPWGHTPSMARRGVTLLCSCTAPYLHPCRQILCLQFVRPAKRYIRCRLITINTDVQGPLRRVGICTGFFIAVFVWTTVILIGCRPLTITTIQVDFICTTGTTAGAVNQIDCTRAIVANDAVCALGASPGIWYVRLRGHLDFSGVSLSATID
jgi:hypothetical protein